MDQILEWMFAHPVVIIAIVVLLYVVFTYNNLNGKRQRVEKSFSTIDVYLQARFDKITSLLEQTLAAYDHESNVYTEVSRLRSGIVKAKTGNINDKVNAENEINAFIANPMFKTEAYPDLESIRTLAMKTAEETVITENELISARRQYNSNVTSYNTKIKSFPAMLIAGILGFGTPYSLFKVEEQAKVRPSINAIRNANQNTDQQ